MDRSINTQLAPEKKAKSKRWFAGFAQHEWRKFCLMATLMFLILLNQNLIRCVKDSLVVTWIGAEVLSFIKLFVEMPAGMLFVALYAFWCNKMTTERVFRRILLFFLFFFLAFGLFLFPHQDRLHPDPAAVAACVRAYPHLKWFFAMWSKWSLVLFYIMGELWPMVVFTLLYWQLANKLTTTQEAGRFYFFFNLIGQSNLLVSGAVVLFFTQGTFLFARMPLWLGIPCTTETMQIGVLMLAIVSLCGCILIVHRWIETSVVPAQATRKPSTEATHLKLGLWESLHTIVRSKYLGLIFVLTVSYSMVIHLIEGLWFYETSLFYQKNAAHFIAYQGRVLFWTGMCTLLGSLLGPCILQKLGWRGTALLTPRVTLAIGGSFFALTVLHSLQALPLLPFGVTSLTCIVGLGGLQNILAKGTKYCFFDVTKEMAYIPLDPEMRTKGKAAVDILGGKVGKSAGALLQVLCYTLFSQVNPERLAPLLLVLFSCICFIWISAVKKLAKQYARQTT